jgi:hypothetical protein
MVTSRELRDLFSEAAKRTIQHEVRPFDRMKDSQQMRITATIAAQEAVRRCFESIATGTALDEGRTVRRSETMPAFKRTQWRLRMTDGKCEGTGSELGCLPSCVPRVTKNSPEQAAMGDIEVPSTPQLGTAQQ